MMAEAAALVGVWYSEHEELPGSKTTGNPSCRACQKPLKIFSGFASAVLIQI